MYLLLKQTEWDDRPYFKLLQYVSVFFMKSYLYIFWLFRLLLRLPPTKYRSPLGVAIDLWNYGTLKVISKSIEEKLVSSLYRSRYCKMFSSFWKKWRYLWELDSLKVFIPIIFFFILFALLFDLLDTVDFLSSSFYLYLSLYLSLSLSLYRYLWVSLSLEICLYSSLILASDSLRASAYLLSSESRSWLVLFPNTFILFFVMIYYVIRGTTSFVLY